MFNPTKKIEDKHIRNIRLTFSHDRYAEISKMSKDRKLSIRDFCTQAVEYAIENIEVTNDTK